MNNQKDENRVGEGGKRCDVGETTLVRSVLSGLNFNGRYEVCVTGEETRSLNDWKKRIRETYTVLIETDLLMGERKGLDSPVPTERE